MNCSLSLILSVSFGKLNVRWKRCPSRIDLSCKDIVCVIIGSGLGGKMFLINPDVAGVLTKQTYTINSKQDHTKKSRSTKPILG